MVAEARGRLSLDGKPFTDTIKQVGQDAESTMKNKMDEIGKSIKQAFTVTAIANYAKGIMAAADQADTLAKRLGITVESAQSLNVIAEDAGLNITDFQEAIIKTTAAANQAVAGNKNLTSAFERLGIGIDDLRSMNPEELFEAVAKSMADNKDDADALGAAYQIIGSEKAGKLQSALIDLGDKGFAALNKEMIESNRIMDEKTIQVWDDFQQKLVDAGRVIQNFIATHGTTFIGWIETAAGYLGTLSAGGTWDDYVRNSAEAELAQRKITDEIERSNDAQRDLVDAQKDFWDMMGKIIEENKKLADDQSKRLGPAERLAYLKGEEAKLIEFINQLVPIGTEEELKQVQARRELLRVQDEMIGLEKKLNEEEKKGPEIARDQVKNFQTLRDMLQGMSDKDIKNLIEQMYKLASAIQALPDVGKDKLKWVTDLANLSFRGVTSSQSRQMVRALKVLVDGLNKLPDIESPPRAGAWIETAGLSRLG